MRHLLPLLLALCVAPASSAQNRLRIAPSFAPGQTLRYQFDLRVTTEGTASGLVQDPQGPRRTQLQVSTTVRLETLPPGADGLPRLRLTYEKAASSARGDSYDPRNPDAPSQFPKLEGRAFVLALDAQNRVSRVEGLQPDAGEEKIPAAADEMLKLLTVAAAFPARGLLVGESWVHGEPLENIPIAGIVLRSEATYMRNEACPAPKADPAGAAPSASNETCAVIVARSATLPRGRHDATPAEYRKRSLRTAGTWAESGETLSYVSLGTGWAVSVTQSLTDDVDYTVSSQTGAVPFRFRGRVSTEGHIRLLR